MKRIIFTFVAALFMSATGAYAECDMNHESHSSAHKTHGKQCPMGEHQKKACCKNMQKGKQCPMHGEGKSCCDMPCCNKSGAHGASTAGYIAAMTEMHEGMNIEYTGDVDTDFARGMIPHHQGAVDMAKVVLKYGHDEDIRSLAEWIISIQNQEIAQMKHWLTRVGAPKGQKAAGYDEGAIAAYEAGMHKMHSEMDITYSGDADVDFVLGMIPHHQGAIEMAKVQLKHGKNAEITKLADGVNRTQNGEIAMMRRWLKARGIECPKAYQDGLAAKKKTSGKKSTHQH